MEKMTKERFFSLDLLKAMACLAVVFIHVNYPLMENFIQSPLWEISLLMDMFSRWCVPVFIMVMGASLLHQKETSFNKKLFLRKRVRKVVIPFLVWTVFYILFSGLTLDGFSFYKVKEVALSVFFGGKEAYYHLGFFYYFIPLYLTAFVLKLFIGIEKERENLLNQHVGTITFFVFMFASGGYSLYIDELFFNFGFFILSFYVYLGWFLFEKKYHCLLFVPIFMVGAYFVYVSHFTIMEVTINEDLFSPLRFLSYKSIGIAVLSISVFGFVVGLADKIKEGDLKTFISLVSKYSFGIYLIHPVFLWVFRETINYRSTTIFMLFMVTTLVFAMSLVASFFISKTKFSWIMPT